MVRRVSTPSDRIVVVGAGCSPLIGELLADGYDSIVAVDISAAALDRLRRSLGDDASRVQTVTTDVCDFTPEEPFAVWHDRATFHFLTEPERQQAYAERVAEALVPGGHMVLAGFAPGGPSRCSGLSVARHSIDDLRRLFVDLDVVEHFELDHATPWNTHQRFSHTLFRRR